MISSISFFTTNNSFLRCNKARESFSFGHRTILLTCSQVIFGNTFSKNINESVHVGGLM